MAGGGEMSGVAEGSPSLEEVLVFLEEELARRRPQRVARAQRSAQRAPPPSRPGGWLTAETPLLRAGLADSLDLAALAIEAVRRFGPGFSSRDLGAEDFETPRALAARLQALRGAS